MKKSFISIFKAVACAIAITMATSCANQNGGNTVAVSGGASVSTDGIACIYLDSLINGYDLYNDEMTKFMAKQNKYEQDLQSKGNSRARASRSNAAPWSSSKTTKNAL